MDRGGSLISLNSVERPQDDPLDNLPLPELGEVIVVNRDSRCWASRISGH